MAGRRIAGSAHDKVISFEEGNFFQYFQLDFGRLNPSRLERALMVQQYF